MSRFAFGLRYFLFGLGSALNNGEHVTWSIDLTQDCANLCRAVCAILITPTAGTCRSSRQLKRNFSAVTFATQSATKRTPPALPEIGREASATVCAPLVVSLPWRVTARCPIVDPDLAPGRSAIPVLVAAMVLTARRLLRFLVLGRSNSILLLGRSNSVLRLRRARGRDRCLPRPRRVALGAGAGSEKRRIDAPRRLCPSQLRRPPLRQATPAPLVACDESVGWDRKSRIRDECNGMRARDRLQQSQASIPSAPWKYNARLYGRGLSKIAHSAYYVSSFWRMPPSRPRASPHGRQSASVLMMPASVQSHGVPSRAAMADIVQQVAGVEDFGTPVATYRAAGRAP